MVKRFYRHAALQQKYYPGSRKIARLHDEMAGRLVLPANLLDELPAGDDRSDQFENCLDDDSHIESSSPAGGPCQIPGHVIFEQALQFERDDNNDFDASNANGCLKIPTRLGKS